MGLDMYVFRTSEDIADVNFDMNDFNDERIFYWRKHPNLHGWMGRLYDEKGGNIENEPYWASQWGNFSGPVQLDIDDINRLEKDVLNNDLPNTTGFFFGESYPEDKVEDLKFIGIAKQSLESGNKLYYYASW